MKGNYLRHDPGRGRANKALQDSLDESEPVFFASYGLIGRSRSWARSATPPTDG